MSENQKGVLKTSRLPVTSRSSLKIATSSHPAPRRVRFASDLVTVKEIPHHFSFTAEEKRSLYRDLCTLQAESDVICQEIEFERSLYGDECLANVLEEDSYFRNRRGELVHPAHWNAFTDEIVDSIDVDSSSVPPGFSSLEAYMKYLSNTSISMITSSRIVCLYHPVGEREELLYRCPSNPSVFVFRCSCSSGPRSHRVSP
jgi:hypothetical protein